MQTLCRKTKDDLISKPITLKKIPLVTKQTKIFTIGSCFALEIAKYLHENKYNVLNHELDQDVDYNLIWYNTFSILYEFSRITGDFIQSENDYWELKNGKFQDPYRRCVFANSKEELFKKIKFLDRSIKEYITTCNVLIITLGLVEVWVSPNMRVINASPGYPKGTGGGQNCKFRFSDYQENLNNIRHSLNILKQMNPECKVVITTSPVALGATFRDMDHLVANTESKCILRTVCGQIEREFDNVTYFPSYEMAMNFNRTEVLKPDGRHIQPKFVEYIMEQFYKYYVGK